MESDDTTSEPASLPPCIPNGKSVLYFSVVFFCYGFFVDFKPSEPFLVPYLIDVKKFTNEQVEQDIFPVWTYSYFVSIVICGLVSEVLQYKPVLIVGSFARLATRLILIFGTSMILMQSMQVTFGFASGSEVLFYSYIYYLVPLEHYQKLTGITRSSVLIGHVGANLLGQLLVSQFHSPLIVLFYISLVSISIAVPISFLFPSTKIEITHCGHTFLGLKAAYFDIIGNTETLQWSFWYILVMMTSDLTLNFSTNLFFVVDSGVQYNGLVMGVVRLSGALGALLPGFSFVENRMEPLRKILVVVLTFASGFLMMIAPSCNIWLVFAFFVIYMGMTCFCISVASAQIAKKHVHTTICNGFCSDHNNLRGYRGSFPVDYRFGCAGAGFETDVCRFWRRYCSCEFWFWGCCSGVAFTQKEILTTYNRQCGRHD